MKGKRLIVLSMIITMCLSIMGNGNIGVVYATEVNDEYNIIDMENSSVYPKNAQPGDVVTWKFKMVEDIEATGFVKGGEFEKGNVSYEIKTKKGKKGTVVYQGSTKKSKKVKVPKTVKIKGTTYTVTEIADNAFKGNTKMTSITIPEGVTKIGKNAFCGCKNLKTITIKSTKLTKNTVGKNAFKGTNKKLVIKVPKKKVNSYKKFLKTKGNKKVTVKKG